MFKKISLGNKKMVQIYLSTHYLQNLRKVKIKREKGEAFCIFQMDLSVQMRKSKR